MREKPDLNNIFLQNSFVQRLKNLATKVGLMVSKTHLNKDKIIVEGSGVGEIQGIRYENVDDQEVKIIEWNFWAENGEIQIGNLKITKPKQGEGVAIFNFSPNFVEFLRDSNYCLPVDLWYKEENNKNRPSERSFYLTKENNCLNFQDIQSGIWQIKISNPSDEIIVRVEKDQNGFFAIKFWVDDIKVNNITHSSNQ